MNRLEPNRAAAILEGIKRARVAVVGDLMVDRYVWGDVERISPEAPVPIVNFRGESANLGGAANVAANVESLGAQVYLFGVAGDDPAGETLTDLLNQHRFAKTSVLRIPGRPTSIKTRIIANNQHVVRVDRETNEDIDTSSEDRLLAELEMVLPSTDAVILEDYNKGVLTPRIIREIVAQCRRLRIPVGADPKRDNFWEYKGVTLFKPNLRELETALGRKLRSDSALESAGLETIQRLGLKYLLVTRGELGMALFTDGSVEFIPTRAQRVHDVSGAGDTVIATLMTALAGGADVREAAVIANHAAGIVIAEVGAVPVDLGELERTLLRG